MWSDLGRVAVASAVGLVALLTSLPQGAWLALPASLLSFGVALRVLGLVGPNPVADLRLGMSRLRSGSEA